MAAEQDPNKRVKIGLAIFAVLVMANVFIHGSRAIRQPIATTSTAPAPQLSQPVAAVISGSLLNGAALLAEGPDVFFDKKTGELSEALKVLRQKLDRIPSPLPPPDLTTELLLSGNDYFKWQRESGKPVDATAGGVSGPVPEPMTILGHFRIGNRTKLLVSIASVSFIIDEDDTSDVDEVSLVHEQGDSFVIKDESGQTRVLQLESLPVSNVQNAVDILRGKQKQLKFPLLPGRR